MSHWRGHKGGRWGGCLYVGWDGLRDTVLRFGQKSVGVYMWVGSVVFHPEGRKINGAFERQMCILNTNVYFKTQMCILYLLYQNAHLKMSNIKSKCVFQKANVCFQINYNMKHKYVFQSTHLLFK